MSALSDSSTLQQTTPVRLSLIGMSGAGKSHWSTLLKTLDFHCFCCDDLIESKLEEVLRPAPDVPVTDGKSLSMAEWMGHPYESQYAEAERHYLKFEVEIMGYVCSFLKEDTYRDKNVVVDTTGSLIYTRAALIECLRAQTTMVYLKTPPESCEKMYRTFLQNPKPVLWQGHFNQNPDESAKAALARCYPELLKSRQKEYERYADVVIDFATQRQAGFGVDAFLKTIRERISA